MTVQALAGRTCYLQPPPKTYEQVHHGLQWVFGPADQHPCVSCGSRAKDWAYQYTAGEKEQKSETGSPYSDDLDHYAPMCRSCHRSFDIKNDPERHISTNFQKAGQDAIRLLMAEGGWGQHRSDNMTSLNQRKVRCGSCDLETNPGALAIHRRSTGHPS